MANILSCNCCVRNTKTCICTARKVPGFNPPTNPPGGVCEEECACETAWIRTLIHVALFLYSISFYFQHCASMLIAEELKIDKNTCNVLIFALKLGLAVTCLPFGRYGDLCCSCRALKSAYLACIVSYIMTLSSWTPIMYYASRIPHFMFHCHLGSQMLLTECSCDFHRTLTLSILGLVFRAGYVMGTYAAPNLLNDYGPRNVVFLSCLGSMIAFLIILKKVPCRRQGPDFQMESILDMLGEVSNPTYFWNLFRTRGIWLFISMKMITEIPVVALYVLMRFIFMDFYNVEPEKINEVEQYILISDLVLHILAVAVIYLLQSDILIIKICLGVLCSAYITLYMTQEVTTFMSSMAVLACTNAVLSITLASICTKLITPCQTGAVLGMNMMAFLLTMEGVPLTFTQDIVDSAEKTARTVALNGALTSGGCFLLFSFIAKLRRRNDNRIN